MTLLVISFGILIALTGTVLLIKPQLIFGLLEDRIERIELQLAAVSVRFILGALLIYLADLSNFPRAIEILGWLSLTAAILLALIGRQGFIALMRWALGLVDSVGRLGGAIALPFGTFLIYAFV